MAALGVSRVFSSMIRDGIFFLFTSAILCIIFSASSYFPWLINHLEDSGIILVIKDKKAELIPYNILYHRLIAGFLIRVRQQVPLVKQELLTLLENLSSFRVFSLIRVAQFYFCCVMFCLPLFVVHCIMSLSIYCFWLHPLVIFQEAAFIMTLLGVLLYLSTKLKVEWIVLSVRTQYSILRNDSKYFY